MALCSHDDDFGMVGEAIDKSSIGRTVRSGISSCMSSLPGSLTFRSELRPSLQVRLHHPVNNGISLLLVHL